ncbi:hypothetical protein TNCV_1833071 [Trichonephila clavipes]|nr:hypothetical protein TNCV_1833071 [Trichonephila clavipes]
MGDTLNSRREASPLVWLGEREERWEAPDHSQSVLPQNWAERRLSESIRAGHRSDNRKPNAIYAVYETGNYTNIDAFNPQFPYPVARFKAL